jgi:hypothetical protein
MQSLAAGWGATSPQTSAASDAFMLRLLARLPGTKLSLAKTKPQFKTSYRLGRPAPELVGAWHAHNQARARCTPVPRSSGSATTVTIQPALQVAIAYSCGA